MVWVATEQAPSQIVEEKKLTESFEPGDAVAYWLNAQDQRFVVVFSKPGVVKNVAKRTEERSEAMRDI